MNLFCKLLIWAFCACLLVFRTQLRRGGPAQKFISTSCGDDCSSL
jgi:hypothetical protein